MCVWVCVFVSLFVCSLTEAFLCIFALSLGAEVEGVGGADLQQGDAKADYDRPTRGH